MGAPSHMLAPIPVQVCLQLALASHDLPTRGATSENVHAFFFTVAKTAPQRRGRINARNAQYTCISSPTTTTTTHPHRQHSFAIGLTPGQPRHDLGPALPCASSLSIDLVIAGGFTDAPFDRFGRTRASQPETPSTARHNSNHPKNHRRSRDLITCAVKPINCCLYPLELACQSPAALPVNSRHLNLKKIPPT